MPQILMFLDKKEDEKVKYFAAKWELSKHDAIKKIIDKFAEQNNGV